MNWGAYLRLMRFHKPIGIILLWLPTMWALWLAQRSVPPFNLIILFSLGTIIMRAAGCVINDIADRDLDLHIKRTKLRPLTSGELKLLPALILLSILLLSAVAVVLQLPQPCIYYAIVALIISLLYPWCKRFLKAPQLVLGMAFSMGIPMAYAAVGVVFNRSALLLFIINFIWIVSYDTMYALVDRADDVAIGIKSTAVLFGSYTLFIIILLQICFHGLWLALAMQANFYYWWWMAVMVLVYQDYLLYKARDCDFMRAFNWSGVYGALMLIGLSAGA